MISSMNNTNQNKDQKVALVTGASSGIGLACAQALADDGYSVFTAQRSEAPGFATIFADLSDPSAPEHIIQSIIDQTNRLDVLVNNAGVMIESDIETMSLDDWEFTMAVNLRAPFLLIKQALPYLQGSGSIVNIGSIEGLASNPEHSAYCASKAGIHGLTRAVAVDHGPQGVRCNAVAPGWIDTDLNLDFINSMPNPEAFKEQIGGIHPIGRTGSPTEIAALVAWLASDKASFITGQIFTADGGRTAKLSLP